MLTIKSVVDPAACPNLLPIDFFWPASKASTKLIKSPLPGITSYQVIPMKGIVPTFTGIFDLCVRAWIGEVDNFAVNELLKTSFIDFCTRRIFHSEWKFCPLAFVTSGNSFHAENLRDVHGHCKTLRKYDVCHGQWDWVSIICVIQCIKSEYLPICKQQG